MDPDEISRLAGKAREQKVKQDAEEAKSAGKKPFNPLDWMDIKNTRKWMGKNLALSDKFYSVLVSVLLTAILLTYFYLDEGETWAFYGMMGSCIALAVTAVGGFMYGYQRARKRQS